MDLSINNSCAWITVNRKCNLECFWCYAKDMRESQIDMPKGLLFNLIGLCKEGGVKKIVFLGGEPTVYPHLCEAISYCKQLSIKTEITTNGIKLSDRSYLSDLCNAGLDSIIISIKGSDRNDFLETTGKDKFESVRLALKHLSKTNIKYGASVVLTLSLINNIENLLPILIENHVEILVCSFLNGYGGDNASITYMERNNPEIILEQLYHKVVKLPALFEQVKWIIESCCHLINIHSDLYDYFKDRLYASCHKYNSPIAFDCEGNLLACNNYPNFRVGKFGVDFNSFIELKNYVQNKK